MVNDSILQDSQMFLTILINKCFFLLMPKLSWFILYIPIFNFDNIFFIFIDGR